MKVDIEIPNLESIFGPATSVAKQRTMKRATISDLYFEEGDEIEEGELIGHLPKNDKEPFHTRVDASGEHPLRQRQPQQFQRRLGRAIRLARQPRPLASCKNHGKQR